MLHPVPESALRVRLLKVVVLQRRLINALCTLPVGAVVDQTWLQSIWVATPADWIRRFWENDTGKRAGWIATIAAATVSDKKTILRLMKEQLRFAEIYKNPPTIRLTDHDWKPTAFAAAKNLLVAFYAPLFYKGEGFPSMDGTLFDKDQYITHRPKICPYNDNFIQDTKLDHFLPKDRFPMLSCHPDNLIPCGTDANSGSHKGMKAPLDVDQADQAAAWFHPRWRSAKDKYRLEFETGAHPQPRIKFIALAAEDQPRLRNMAQMFGLEDFWGGFLDDEVQSVAGDVRGWLIEDGKPATDANVKSYVLKRARQERNRIGKDGLAIVKSYFYDHIANAPLLLAQVIRTCQTGT